MTDGAADCFERNPLGRLRRSAAPPRRKRPSTWGPGSAWVGRANKAKSVYGVALHAVTQSAPGSAPVIEAISLTPAPALPAAAAAPLLELLAERRSKQGVCEPVGLVVADPAYSANASDWQLPIRRLGGSPDFRLHRQNQAGREMRAGELFVDGRPYCSCLPEELIDVGFPKFPYTRAQAAAFQQRVAKRQRFEMTPNTAFRPDGSRQFRYPHWDPKRRTGGCSSCVGADGDQLIDPLTKVSRPPCCSRATKVFSESDLGLYQDVAFGEADWFEAWDQRDRVEGSFGALKNLALTNWGHDYHHFVGLVRETLVATFAVIAHNLHIERNWVAKLALRERQSPRIRFKRRRRNSPIGDGEPELAAPTAPAGRGPKGLEFLGSPRAGP